MSAKLSDGSDKKETTKRNEHVGMQKGAYFCSLPTTLLNGFNMKFLRNLRIAFIIFSDHLPYNKISSESKKRRNPM